jgi:hypothetical protein
MFYSQITAEAFLAVNSSQTTLLQLLFTITAYYTAHSCRTHPWPPIGQSPSKYSAPRCYSNAFNSVGCSCQKCKEIAMNLVLLGSQTRARDDGSILVPLFWWVIDETKIVEMLRVDVD